MEDRLKKLYDENGFPGQRRLYLLAKENGVKVTQKKVSEFVKKQAPSQLFQEERRSKKDSLFIVAGEPYQQVQIDLVDMSSHQYHKKKWILVAIDIYSRQGYGIPITSKAPKYTTRAMEELLKEMPRKPDLIQSDNGSEWKGSFAKLLDNEAIGHVTNLLGDHNSLGVVDRFIRTLKTKLFQHIETRSSNWVEYLPKLLKIYNQTPNDGLGGVSPNKATGAQKLEVQEVNRIKKKHNEKVIERRRKKGGLKVGDKVLVRVQKAQFERGFKPRYDPTVHKIASINGNRITLKDGDTVPLKRVKKIETGASLSKITNAVRKAVKVARAERMFRRSGLDEKHPEPSAPRGKRSRRQRKVLDL